MVGACLAIALLVTLPPRGPEHLFSQADPAWPSLIFVPLASAPLLWRRSHPAIVVSLLVAVFCASIPWAPTAAVAGLLCAAYSVARYGTRRPRLAAGAVGIVALAAAVYTSFIVPYQEVKGALHFVLFGYGIAWLAGDRVRTHRAYVAALEERAVRLERERDEQAQRAAEEERMRIARELHDVVAHNVSLIAVQAGAVRATSAAHPERAGEALGLIERTARTTLSELRALLGVLRKNDEDDGAKPPLRPQPSLAQMDELVEHARAAGLRVTARVEGRVQPLAAMTDLCAYRILQESLTNAAKHSPGCTVRVLLRWEKDALTIAVADGGGKAGPGQPEWSGPGHGLAGRRERVALAGGELRAGPAQGGFMVEARLPLGGDDTPPLEGEPASALAAGGETHKGPA
jgi:signal transduction histidine kinase